MENVLKKYKTILKNQKEQQFKLENMLNDGNSVKSD